MSVEMTDRGGGVRKLDYKIIICLQRMVVTEQHKNLFASKISYDTHLHEWQTYLAKKETHTHATIEWRSERFGFLLVPFVNSVNRLLAIDAHERLCVFVPVGGKYRISLFFFLFFLLLIFLNLLAMAIQPETDFRFRVVFIFFQCVGLCVLGLFLLVHRLHFCYV